MRLIDMNSKHIKKEEYNSDYYDTIFVPISIKKEQNVNGSLNCQENCEEYTPSTIGNLETDENTHKRMKNNKKRCIFRRRHLCRRTYNRFEGCVWGFYDGMTTGWLTGLRTTGKGGRIFGGATQLIGATCSSACCAMTGAFCGALSNKYKMLDVMEDYRKKF